MVYNDYVWTAGGDHDNPKIIGGTDRAELNRKEGYEMLHFINSLAKTWNWPAHAALSSFQNIEKIIRTKVPSTTRTHSGIKEWIDANYSKV